MFEVELIKRVKQHPVLYDGTSPEYRNHKSRYEAWKDIAKLLNANAEDCKNKWYRLRNCYTNALERRNRGNEKSLNNPPWIYETNMEFLLPHIEQRTYDIKNRKMLMKAEDASNSNESQMSEEIKVCTPSRSKRKISETFYEDVDDIVKPTQETVYEMDENDHFFMSMSKQLKKLPKIDQTNIKFQLHKLIHESELRYLKKK